MECVLPGKFINFEILKRGAFEIAPFYPLSPPFSSSVSALPPPLPRIRRKTSEFKLLQQRPKFEVHN